jgi:OTU domain-containing protein 3
MASRFLSLSALLKSRKLRVVEITGDGNCFYRAVARAFHKDEDFHLLIRSTLMEHIVEDPTPYTAFFENEKRLRNLAHANKKPNTWNSDLADVVPFGISNLLNCRVEVYSVNGNDGGVSKFVFGEDKGSPIRLMHVNGNHYNLLEKN